MKKFFAALVLSLYLCSCRENTYYLGENKISHEQQIISALEYVDQNEYGIYARAVMMTPIRVFKENEPYIARVIFYLDNHMELEISENYLNFLDMQDLASVFVHEGCHIIGGNEYEAFTEEINFMNIIGDTKSPIYFSAIEYRQDIIDGRPYP